MSTKERMRFGGRSARIQAAVHQAVNDLSTEMDRAEITVPMIAARAGVTPSTVYRRWGDLSELMADVAVQRLRPIADPADTGGMWSDLEAWAEQYMEEMSSPVGQALLRDVLGTLGESDRPEQCCQFTNEQLGTIAARAAARGETPFRVDEVVDHLVAPLVFHIIFNDREVGPDYCRALIARLKAR
ncbi:TetR/AcrR family transcriptional regulator C-terminal ligand-binding domain-containing protein [Aquabacter sp. CN5-332]|uniref:TetR/AcrR family transcriptional regulator n=1 Tax=Aquabacter sp. CN5-332 TaxID=3156608 RepID=UPI0032B4046C